MQKNMKTHELYKSLMSQASQCTLQVLDRNWKSFFEGMKEWKKNPSKFLGMPKLPKYLKKDGQFPWFLKNNNTYIKDGYLRFKLKVFNGYGFKTSVKGRLISVRFIPRGAIYVLEIVYETNVPDIKKESLNIASIDLGVNNFVTMVDNIGSSPIIINGKGLKSINQFFNKRRSILKKNIEFDNGWSNKLEAINLKRNNRIKNFMHHTSKRIVEECRSKNIDTLVVGRNKEWKQETRLGDKTTQNFAFIPYYQLIQQLQYKCQNYGIRFVETDESYTSGTSFLDNEAPIKDNYNKKRRKKRGLFKSNEGYLINADVNGAYQIMKKVFPNAYGNGIEARLTPVMINVVTNGRYPIESKF